jgi:hypothetical protein
MAGGMFAFGIVMSVNTVTYKADSAGTLAGRNPSPGQAVPSGLKSEGADALPFRRPSEDVLSEAIPAFFIGRNQSGFWVARDADGKSGGLFWSREAALRFANRVWPDGCATIFPQARFELDIDNAGNPLISWLEAARHWLARRRKSWLRLPK